MSKYYIYVLRSLSDKQLYVGLTENLLYWEGCLNRSDAAQREKYLKTAWGKRYLKNRLRRYLTG